MVVRDFAKGGKFYKYSGKVLIVEEGQIQRYKELYGDKSLDDVE